MKSILRLAVGMALAAIGALALARAAAAEPIRHPTAVFAGLDKITGRIINFDVAVDETVQFGALQLTPRVCNTRPQTETPQTTSFVEIDERIAKPGRGENKPEGKQEAKRLFSGWMFAASPGLHGVEHSVYDVWLVDCKGGKETAQTAAAPATDKPAAEADKPGSRRVEPAAPAPVENQPIGPADQPDGALVDAPASVDPAATPAAIDPAAIDPAAMPADPEAAPAEPVKKKHKKRRRPREEGLTPEPPPPGDPLQPF